MDAIREEGEGSFERRERRERRERLLHHSDAPSCALCILTPVLPSTTRYLCFTQYRTRLGCPWTNSSTQLSF